MSEENQAPPAPTPETRPAGWWAIRDASGSVAGVVRDIGSRGYIPDYWRAALEKEITARCGDRCNFVYVDAHCHVEGDGFTLHITIQPDTKLL